MVCTITKAAILVQKYVHICHTVQIVHVQYLIVAIAIYSSLRVADVTLLLWVFHCVYGKQYVHFRSLSIILYRIRMDYYQ